MYPASLTIIGLQPPRSTQRSKGRQDSEQVLGDSGAAEASPLRRVLCLSIFFSFHTPSSRPSPSSQVPSEVVLMENRSLP